MLTNYNGQRITLKSVCLYVLVLVLSWTLVSCSDRVTAQEPTDTKALTPTQVESKLAEVAPPETILQLRQVLDQYQPQVTIVSPQAEEILSNTTVKVNLQVRDLPIFKDQKLEMGPHLHVFLDNQPYKAVYDVSKPLILENIEPGTHTLRVFASRPWHESFKNDGAYAQTTFHVLTKTDDNNPDSSLPLLTYSRPEGIYGAEPIMLDFYLTNAPLHLVARENANDEIPDWRIRVTVNDETFVLEQWQPIYLTGFNKGNNWVKLEFIDEQGKVVKNVFNTTARQIIYDPKLKDTLSQLVTGKLSANNARAIVDPNYQPQPVTIEEPAPVIEETPELTETQETPIIEETPVIAPETELPTAITTETKETDVIGTSEPVIEESKTVNPPQEEVITESETAVESPITQEEVITETKTEVELPSTESEIIAEPENKPIINEESANSQASEEILVTEPITSENEDTVTKSEIETESSTINKVNSQEVATEKSEPQENLFTRFWKQQVLPRISQNN